VGFALTMFVRPLGVAKADSKAVAAAAR
jgi:hypothetical protein